MRKIIDISEAERRSDRRHPSFVPARLNGQPVTLLDISLGGFAGSIELRGESDAIPAEGATGVLEIYPDSPSSVSVEVEIRRCDKELRLFGAQLVEMNDQQFRALERLAMGRQP